MIDLELHPLDVAIEDPSRLLHDYRDRLRRTTWAEDTVDTLIAPVWSPAASIAGFEDRLAALYRAHLRLLHAVQTRRDADGLWGNYCDLLRGVRDFRDWPVLGQGEPVAADDLIAADAMRWMYGRPDIVIAADGPKVVETNFDTAVAGYEKPDDLWHIAATLFSPPPEYLARGGPLQGLGDYFAEFAGAQPCDVHWIMKNHAAVKRLLAPVLGRLNRHTEGVRHRMHYVGEDVVPPDPKVASWLYRACSIYTVRRDPARFATLLAALWPAMRGCTVPLWLSVLDSKLLLAWLSDPRARPDLADDERDAVETLLPWTRVLALLDDGQRNLLKRDRGEYILKKSDSHQAKEVHFGCNLDDDAWAALIDRLAGEPSWLDGASNIWIVQRRVHPRAYDLIEYTDAGAVPRRAGLSCCPYLMGGKLRGLETWVLPFVPDMQMIRRMQFVPHFIRDGAAALP